MADYDYGNVYDDVMDPSMFESGRTRSQHRFGRLFLKDDMPFSVLENRGKKGALYFFVMPRPTPDGTDTYPLLYVKPEAALAAETTLDSMYGLSTVFWARIARFIGPTPPGGYENAADDTKKKYQKMHVLNDLRPEQRKYYASRNEPLPPQLFDVICARSGDITRMRDDWARFAVSNELGAALHAPTPIFFLPCFWYVLDASTGTAELRSAVDMMSESTYRSLKETVMAPRQGYVFPAGATRQQLSSREYLNQRFIVPDLGNYACTYPIKIEAMSFQSQSKRGGVVEYTRLIASVANLPTVGPQFGTNTAMQATGLDLQRIKNEWLNPDQILNYDMTGRQALTYILDHSPEASWSNFLMECVRGSEFEVTQGVQGFSTPTSVQPPVTAAVQTVQVSTTPAQGHVSMPVNPTTLSLPFETTTAGNETFAGIPPIGAGFTPSAVVPNAQPVAPVQAAAPMFATQPTPATMFATQPAQMPPAGMGVPGMPMPGANPFQAEAQVSGERRDKLAHMLSQAKSGAGTTTPQ